MIRIAIFGEADDFIVGFTAAAVPSVRDRLMLPNGAVREVVMVGWMCAQRDPAQPRVVELTEVQLVTRPR